MLFKNVIHLLGILIFLCKCVCIYIYVCVCVCIHFVLLIYGLDEKLVQCLCCLTELHGDMRGVVFSIRLH
jgi:hypothetical protein